MAKTASNNQPNKGIEGNGTARRNDPHSQDEPSSIERQWPSWNEAACHRLIVGIIVASAEAP
jgi:hypothetical protein